jgi:hypothetical protein
LDQAEAVTTEQHDEEFVAIAWMVRQGASSWVGPTPRAAHARWATRMARRPGALVSKRRMPGLVFTAVVFFTVMAVAASITPGGILSLSRTVSGVVSQKMGGPQAPATISPSAAHGGGPTSQPAASPTVQPGAVQSLSPPPATPVDDHGGGSGRGPGPPSPRPTDD